MSGKHQQKAAKGTKAEQARSGEWAADMVLHAADEYERVAQLHCAITMGQLDRNEHQSRRRVDAALEKLLETVLTWRSWNSRRRG